MAAEAAGVVGAEGVRGAAPVVLGARLLAGCAVGEHWGQRERVGDAVTKLTAGGHLACLAPKAPPGNEPAGGGGSQKSHPGCRGVVESLGPVVWFQADLTDGKRSNSRGYFWETAGWGRGSAPPGTCHGSSTAGPVAGRVARPTLSCPLSIPAHPTLQASLLFPWQAQQAGLYSPSGTGLTGGAARAAAWQEQLLQHRLLGMG